MSSPTTSNNTSNEDIVIVESADYAQVVFDDVKAYYSNSKPIECSFTLNQLLKADKSDWIGIYKVGFENINRYVAIQTPKLEELKENKGTVLFPNDVLPKDESGSFYQFAYVSHGQHLRGASLPFQFKNDSDIELSAENTSVEQNAIPIKFDKIEQKYDMIEENIIKLLKERDGLKEELDSTNSDYIRLKLENEKISSDLKMERENTEKLRYLLWNLEEQRDELLAIGFQSRISELQQKLEEERAKNDSAHSLCEKKYDQLNGFYYVLRKAHSSLESRLNASEQLKLVQKQANTRLMQENQELKERIQADTLEYARLADRYRLLKNQHFSGDLSEYHDLSGGDANAQHLMRKPNSSRHGEDKSISFDYEHLSNTSAAQDKTTTQSRNAHASNVDIENTLLDALLGTSLLSTTWSPNNKSTPQPKSTPLPPQLNEHAHKLAGDEDLLNMHKKKIQQQLQLHQIQKRQQQQRQHQAHVNQHQNALSHHYDHQSHAQSQSRQAANNSSHQIKSDHHDKTSQLLNHQHIGHYQEASAMKNSDKNKILCEVCNSKFDATRQYDIDKHYAQHYGPTCPMCLKQFEVEFVPDEYLKHVNSHFENDN